MDTLPVIDDLVNVSPEFSDSMQLKLRPKE